MANAQAPQEASEFHLTAWHVFLVELLQSFTDLRRVEVRDFVKLGTLPLEADVIFLLKMLEASDPGARLMQDELDFLEPRLRRLTVLEYKSPADLLTRQAVHTSRVYGLLAKRKFEVEHDREVSIVMMYSYAERGLFEALKKDGLPFEEEQEGIRCCRGSLTMYAVDLMVLSRLRPKNPLNLMSARHREYSQDPSMDQRTMALVEKIQYLIRQRKARGMALDKLQGFEELSQDLSEIRQRLLGGLDSQEKQRFLGGLDSQEKQRFLGGLDAKERLEGLGAAERLEGLGAAEQDELLTLLLARRQQR